MSMKLPSEVLRYQVLFICREQPSYGYEVVSSIEEYSEGYWKPSSGTVYPLIDRLKEEGLLRELDQNEVEKRGLEGEDRKYFAITNKGEEEIQEVLDNLDDHKEHFENLILGYLNIYAKIFGENNLEQLIDEVENNGSFKDSC